MKNILAIVSAALAVGSISAADVAGSSTTYTFVPVAEGDNNWSDTAEWFDSLTAATPFGQAPGESNDVVLTRPIADAAHPLIWPGSSVTIQAFNVGDASCGKAGNYFFSFPSGANFTVNGQSIWARNAGKVVANIEAGATATFNDKLLLGRTANSSGIITNRGSVVMNGNLILGGFNGASGEMEVYGTLTLNAGLILGQSQSGTTGRLVLHQGGSITKKNAATSSANYFSIGQGAIGELVLEDVFYPCGGECISLGGDDASAETRGTYRGTLVMTGNGGIDSSSTSGSLAAGKGKYTRGDIVMSGNAGIYGTKGTYLYIGYGENSIGTLTMSDNAYVTGVGDRDPHFAYGKRSEATVSLSGSSKIESNNKFYIGQGYASTANVEVVGSSHLKSSTYFYIGNGEGSISKVTVGSGSYLKTGRSFALASGENADATLRLEGGGLQVRPYATSNGYRSLDLGTANSTAILEGWGSISQHTSAPSADSMPLGIYLDGGQVIADGAGTDHDLGFNIMTDVGTAESVNASGKCGWYAKNHGRVIFPHNRAVGKNATFCVGDYYAKTTPDLVNACAVTLAGNSSGCYLHAALYAPDRSDVPSGLTLKSKDQVMGVWRMGYATGQTGATPGYAQNFTSATLKFRYDAASAGNGVKAPERFYIEVYRYNGTEWTKVATQENDVNNPYVTLSGITPYTDSEVAGYNLGWTAIVARYIPTGCRIIIR